MKEQLLSVKEYAERHKTTRQAVYKRIQAGTLKTVDRKDGSRTIKYIIEQTQDTDPGNTEPINNDQNETNKALEMAIAALTAQLEEKNKQIDKLLKLLDQSHTLQLYYGQKMLEGSHTEQSTVDLYSDSVPSDSVPSDSVPSDPVPSDPVPSDPVPDLKKTKRKGLMRFLFGA